MAYLHRDRVNGRLRGRRGARLATPHLGRSDPRDRRLPRVDGAGRRLHRHRQRGLRDRVLPGRRLPARHPPVADRPGDQRRHAGPRRHRQAPDDPVLGGRGAGPHRRAVGGGLAAAERGCGAVSTTAGAMPLSRACGRYRASTKSQPRWSWTTCRRAGPSLEACCPPTTTSCSSASSTSRGGMQLILHAPLGARINRALGLGLRKKFCLNFDFELQAAASNDAVLLSLGPQHSFPLEDVPAFLRSHNAQDAVSQAVLRSPMFTARWRWNLNRSLAVLRRKGGRLNPFNIQRMESDDLMAAVFPVACSLPGQRAGRSGRDSRSPARARDDGRLPQRGHGHRGPEGARAALRGGDRSPAFPRHRRAQRAGARDPQRCSPSPSSTRTPRSLSAGRARCRCAAACRWSLESSAGSTPPRSSGCGPRRRRTCATRTSSTTCCCRSSPRSRGRNGTKALQPSSRRAARSRSHVVGQVLWAATERRNEIEALFPGVRFTPDHPVPAGLPALGAGGRRRGGGGAGPRSPRRLWPRDSGRPLQYDSAAGFLADDRARGASRERFRCQRAVRAGAG